MAIVTDSYRVRKPSGDKLPSRRVDHQGKNDPLETSETRAKARPIAAIDVIWTWRYLVEVHEEPKPADATGYQ
jgi:hypothetical protein